jgi:hypothetical protein
MLVTRDTAQIKWQFFQNVCSNIDKPATDYDGPMLLTQKTNNLMKGFLKDNL